jgi:hypothetical protein
VPGNPKSIGTMRVQLQQQSSGRTIHHGSEDIRAGGGVTAAQLTASLRQRRAHPTIPGREQAGADAALAKTIRWVESRLPAGVSERFGKSFYFDPRNPRDSWCFAIEALSGYNLRT